jgi:hypothetical protein
MTSLTISTPRSLVKETGLPGRPAVPASLPGVTQPSVEDGHIHPLLDGSPRGAEARTWPATRAEDGNCDLAGNKLQQLANRTGLTITTSHFPTGTSKWNSIEHRIFSYISRNWRGVGLAVIVNLIGATRRATGLRVRCELTGHRASACKHFHIVGTAGCEPRKWPIREALGPSLIPKLLAMAWTVHSPSGYFSDSTPHESTGWWAAMRLKGRICPLARQPGASFGCCTRGSGGLSPQPRTLRRVYSAR